MSALPAKRRLRKAAEFKAVMKKPVARSNRFFRVLAARSEHPRSRLGLAVSRRVDKRAVRRNHIKRHVREAFRQLVAEDEPMALDLVVMARGAAAGADGETLRDAAGELMTALYRDFQESEPD